MFNEKIRSIGSVYRRWLSSLSWRGALSLAILFFLIEFFDEFNYAIDGAALPALRNDLGLSYAQVGVLLGLPHILGSVIEMVIMLLGDTPLRKKLIVGGGLMVCLSVVLVALSHSFSVLLVAMVIGFPASGAFVTLSQATLMDLNPGREPHMMARWTLFGSLGNLIGPLILAGGFAMAIGWRWAFFMLGGLALILTLAVGLAHLPSQGSNLKPDELPAPARPSFGRRVADTARDLGGNLKSALFNPALLRWTVLLLLSDLLLDILTSYLPLYFTDVVRMTTAQSSLMMSAVMLASLVSDIIVIPLLERLPGRSVVRVSAAVALVLYPLWLLAPWLWAKVLLALALKLSVLGWYPVLQGEAFAAVPGHSGTVMAINSLAGLLGGLIPWTIGLVAYQAGLPAAMWLLLLGPLSLVLFVPKAKR